MIAPLWRGVDRIVVECAASDSGIAKRLCTAAVAEAGRDAPLPVIAATTVAPTLGDAVFRLRLADATLFVTMERGVVIDDGEGLLAARPVEMATDDDAVMAASIARAFDAALPWRRAANQGFSRSRRS